MQFTCLFYLMSFILAYIPGPECFVCQALITPANYTHFFDCDHANIHQECVNEWVEVKQSKVTCPLCRAMPLVPIEDTNPASGLSQSDLFDMIRSFEITTAEDYILQDRRLEFFMLLENLDFPTHLHLRLMRYEARLRRWSILQQHIHNMRILDIVSMHTIFVTVLIHHQTQIAFLMVQRSTQYEKMMLNQRCITSRNWECSNFLNQDYHATQSVYNIGELVVNAARKDMPIALFRNMVNGRHTVIFAKSVEVALSITLRSSSWLHFSTLLSYGHRHNLAFRDHSWTKILKGTIMRGSNELLREVLTYPSLKRASVFEAYSDIVREYGSNNPLGQIYFDSKINILGEFVNALIL